MIHRKLTTITFVAIVCVGLGLVSYAQDKPSAGSIVGTWKVDLRPTPDAGEYYQQLVVAPVEGDTFTGTFYGSPIEEGRLNRDWGVLCFAFVTRDASGEYHHSGRLVNGRLEGLSHSIGRKFLSVWSAEPQR